MTQTGEPGQEREPRRSAQARVWQLVAGLSSIRLLDRKLTLAAFFSTLSVLTVLAGRTNEDSLLLLKNHDIQSTSIFILYAVLVVVTGLSVIFEPQIRAELADGKSTGLIIALAGSVSFLVVLLNGSDQATRLFSYPFSLWLMIAHLSGLCCLAVALAMTNWMAVPGKRIRRYALISIVTFGIALSLLHILGVGRFMQWDPPNEPWLGSIAINYAEKGSLDAPYVASVFGAPIAQRYYLLMGLWLRAVGTSLITLRAFPLIVAGIIALIFGVALWSLPTLTKLQKATGIVTLIGLSAFVRTSHHLRADTALGVYGVLVWMGLVFFFRHGQKRWLALTGLAAYIGMEAQPTAAVLLASAIGLVIVMQSIRQPLRQTRWSEPAVYAAACAIAILTYLAVHFLPDISASLAEYRRWVDIYLDQGKIGLNTPFAILFDHHVRFSLILSPVELLVSGVAIVVLIRSHSIEDRCIAAVAVIGFLLIAVLMTSSYGYLVFFAPFCAYAIARLCRAQLATTLIAFVLLPAMFAAPLYDMVADIDRNLPQREIDETNLITWRVPEGITVLGEDNFWYSLHSKRQFISPLGLRFYTAANNVTPEEAIESLGVGMIICREGENSVCKLARPELFDPPVEFVITSGKYLVYKRKNL